MDRELKWFLVEYDRHERELVNLTEYAEPEQRNAAWSRLRELEKEQWPELDQCLKTGGQVRMEYVLLIAESEEDIRVTHGNYFNGSSLSVAEYRELMSRKEDGEVVPAAD